MKQVLARCTAKQPELGGGLLWVECPVCAQVIRELDVVRFQKERTEDRIELCDSCMDDSERELGVQFNSDVLEPEAFEKLADWVERNTVDCDESALTEHSAGILAAALGGESWQSGGNIWLVLIRRTDGRLVVISDECVCEYASAEDFDRAKAAISIRFS